MTRVIIIFYKQIEKVSEYFFGCASGWIDVSPSKLRGEIQSVCSQTRSQVFPICSKVYKIGLQSIISNVQRTRGIYLRSLVYNFRMWLLAGTVPAFKKLLAGTVPVFKRLLAGTHKFLFLFLF